MDRSPPGSSVHGTSQARNTGVGCRFLLRGIFLAQRMNLSLLHLLHWQADPLTPRCLKVKVLLAESYPTLCDPMDYSPPGSSVLGILQARILEWVAISFSRESSRPTAQTWVSRPRLVKAICPKSQLGSGGRWFLIPRLWALELVLKFQAVQPLWSCFTGVVTVSFIYLFSCGCITQDLSSPTKD